MFAREKPKDPAPEEHEVTYVNFRDYGSVIIFTATDANRSWYRSEYILKYDPALEKPKIKYERRWEQGVSALPFIDLSMALVGKKHYWKKTTRILLFRDIDQLREYSLSSKIIDLNSSR